MAIKKECLQCTKIRHSTYGMKCSYYGRQPMFDDTQCLHYDGILTQTSNEDSTSDVSATYATNAPKTERKCPYCGEVIADAAIKCKHCGEWLTDDESDEDNEKEGQGFHFSNIVKTVITFILDFFFSFRDNDES